MKETTMMDLNKKYVEKRFKLYQGDCLDVMQHLISKNIKVDAVITDPPYGTTSCKWDSVIPFELMWDRIFKLVRNSSAVALFGSEPFSSYLRISNIKRFKYDWVWDKKTGLGFLDAKNRPLKQHELVSIFSVGGCSNGSNPKMNYYPQGLIPTNKKNKNTPSNILNSEPNKRVDLKTTHTNYPKSIVTHSREVGLHPTQKPVSLIEYLIKTYTKENEIVLDFTFGSCSTGVACLNTNRRFIGIEKDHKYFEIGKNRMITRKEELVNIKETENAD